MTCYAWLTDIHLEFLGSKETVAFVKELASQKLDGLFLAGDIPPFKESCWHEGEISADDWLPHFSCKAVGDVLTKSMATCPDKQMTVLCGHTHSSGMCRILPNLQVKTSGAKYGSPMIQEVLT